MKKILAIIAVLAITSTAAQAAAIQWSVSGIATAVLTNPDNTTAASSTLYFVLADDLSSLSGNTTKEDFASALAAITLATAETGSDGKKPSITKQVVTSDLLEVGKDYTFGLLYVGEDAKGDGFFKYVTATKAAYDVSAPTTAKEVKTSFSNLANASYGSKAYTAVPEPSTAVLALAGLALLLKRRRA